jgi:hypothetical protein
MFVQLYAVYEHTVKEIVRVAIAEMKQRATPVNTIRFELLSLALDHLLQAAADCSMEQRWGKRIELFQRIDSPDPLDTADSAFPSNGRQYRLSQLYTIWAVFGIDATATPVIPSPRLTQVVDELVENRNAVAHGRRTPEDVGGRYSRDEIYNRIDVIQDICNHLVTSMQLHCGNSTNLQR